VTQWLIGSGQMPALVWVGGALLGVGLPLVGWGIAGHAFQGIARPLADLMDAADAVAAGDLHVQVSEESPGDFGRIAQTFNRMARELERAEEQRRNLTADVAHELRTPLAIIQGNLEGLLDGVYQPTAAHFHAMLDETRWLARLIDDLRLLSLAESGQLVLHTEAIAVDELLADSIASGAGIQRVPARRELVEDWGWPLPANSCWRMVGASRSRASRVKEQRLRFSSRQTMEKHRLERGAYHHRSATHKRFPHGSQGFRSGVRVVVSCVSGRGVRLTIVFCSGSQTGQLFYLSVHLISRQIFCSAKKILLKCPCMREMVMLCVGM
jgi:hypothetical protein